LTIDLGRTKYEPVWGLQKKLVVLRAQSRIPDCLILTEHEPVITMGRATNKANLLEEAENLASRGIDLYEIERGGDITFHGPGQTVLYPIVDLRNRGRDVRRFLRGLERFVVEALRQIGLNADVRDGLTGIWVGDYKLGAIGVAVSRWITYHGVALNVGTDLEYFRLINPCGIVDYPVGTVSLMLGEDVAMDYVNDLLVKSFAETFGLEASPINDIDRFLSGLQEP
jgi:lipoate-protein ligase B